MSDHDRYPLSLPGFESVQPGLVQHVMAIEATLSRHTSLVYFKNSRETLEHSWQQLCDSFEEVASEDTVIIVDGDLRSRVSEIGFAGHHEDSQVAHEVAPVELLLRMGDRLIPDKGIEHDRLFAHLLSSYVNSRSLYSPDPSGSEHHSAVRFQTARAAHEHLRQLKRGNQGNRYVNRIEKVLALADLSYHPVASRARKLGGSVLEKISDAVDLG